MRVQPFLNKIITNFKRSDLELVRGHQLNKLLNVLVIVIEVIVQISSIKAIYSQVIADYQHQ